MYLFPFRFYVKKLYHSFSHLMHTNFTTSYSIWTKEKQQEEDLTHVNELNTNVQSNNNNDSINIIQIFLRLLVFHTGLQSWKQFKELYISTMMMWNSHYLICNHLSLHLITYFPQSIFFPHWVKICTTNFKM